MLGDKLDLTCSEVRYNELQIGFEKIYYEAITMTY